MNRLLILMMVFLLSCSSSVTNKDFKFSDDMTFDEFKKKLDEYSRNKPYPIIDN